MSIHSHRRFAAVAVACAVLFPLVGAAAPASAEREDVPKAANYLLKARHSNKCVAPAAGATGDGVAVLQLACNGSAAQRWYTVYLAPGLYELRNTASNRCLDLYGWVNADAVATIVWACHGGTNQHWYITHVGSGYYEFRSRATGRCLDIAFGSHFDGIPAYQWGCHGGHNQQFYFA